MLTLVGLQSTMPSHSNPVSDKKISLQTSSDVGADVAAIFERACNDCHSNNTKWRWYTYVVPVAWFTVGHVNDGRAELNFSEWGSYSERKKDTRLKAICDLCHRGEMPLPSYVLVHSDAGLSSEEVEKICEWVTKERSILALGQK